MSFRLATDRSAFATMVDALESAVVAAPEREAVRCDGRSLTYGELGGAVAELSRRLTRAGARGERVAIVMPNAVEVPIALFATFAAGAQAALLNPAYPPDALRPLLADAAPLVVLARRDHHPALPDLAAEVGADLVCVGDSEVAAWRSTAFALPAPRPAPTDLATLMYTGGTTGVSKGVDHDHANVMRTVEGMEACWPTRVDEEVWLSVAPLFHIWGLLMGCLNPVYGRARVVLMSRFDPTEMAHLLSRERVTVFGGGPAAIYGGLLSVPSIGDLDLGALRACPGGGSPFPDELLRRWEDIVSVPIYEAFGMSEAAPITANPTDGVRKPGSVGLPAPGMEVDVVALDQGRHPLPVGGVGEIRVRSSRTLLRYRNRPDETAQALVDGWLYTGDIGRFDEDGYLYIVDRKKDMVLVGGFNVYPREIDEVLCGHPDVHESATIGTADDRKGERPVSFVVPLPGRTVDVDDLHRRCGERLVDYKRPAVVVVTDTIPKTPANKTDRKALRQMWTEVSDATPVG